MQGKSNHILLLTVSFIELVVDLWKQFFKSLNFYNNSPLDNSFIQDVGYSLAADATIHDFMFVSDVTSQTGSRGEGALTFVTRKFLQILHNTGTYMSMNTSDDLYMHLKTKWIQSNYLAMLFSHMGNVVFPVCVTCMAWRTLPPWGGLHPLCFHFLFFIFIHPFLLIWAL